jgi:hypothetical protein
MNNASELKLTANLPFKSTRNTVWSVPLSSTHTFRRALLRPRGGIIGDSAQGMLPGSVQYSVNVGSRELVKINRHAHLLYSAWYYLRLEEKSYKKKCAVISFNLSQTLSINLKLYHSELDIQ